MIRQFTRLVTGEVRGMHNAAYLLGTFTLLSSALAFLRDRLLAHSFGAGLSLDLYYAAFRVPDLIFVTIASLVSAYVLIPEFMKRTESGKTQYIETIMVYFCVTIIIVSALVFIFAPMFLSSFFPVLMNGSGGEHLLSMTRIMLLQPIFLGMSNILATIVQSKSRYVIYSLSPLFYNLGIILGVLVLYPIFGLNGLALGVVLGALMHFLTAVPTSVSDGFFNKIPTPGYFKDFMNTILISLPRTLALSANHIALFVLIAIAGTLSIGSITVFTFAFNLQSVPIAIIGISYSVAAFPILASSFAAGKKEEFVGLLSQAARHILFWMIPASALVVVLRAQIVRVILGSGQFDWADTRLTAAIFALFAVALTAQAMVPLIARGYYATGRSWIPFLVNGGSATVAVVLAFVWSKDFVKGGYFHDVTASVLRVSDVSGTEVLALPLAFAVSSIVGAAVLVFLFEYEFGGLLKGIRRVFIQSIIAGLAGGAAAYAVLNLVGGFVEVTTFGLVLLDGLVAGIAGLVAVVISYVLMRSVEISEVFKSLTSRVRPRSASVAVSSEDELS